MDDAAEKPSGQRVPLNEASYVVAIGGSAGGMRAVRQLLSGLPHDFPAPVLLVLHLPARQPNVLAELLDVHSPLRVAFARDGETIEAGRVYVAPADLHLLVQGGKAVLRRGPIENNSRPAIDPLFRSVGTEHGARAIGILVSGMLSDGASGLLAIKRCGGITIVQDPEEAEFSDMPDNARATGAVDHVAGIDAIAKLLIDLIARPPSASPAPPADVVLETRIAAEPISGVELTEQLGSRSVLSCPDCQGALWQIKEGELVRYRCHVGHAYTADTLEEAQISELDRALGTALRVIDERVHILRGLAEEAHQRQRPRMAEQWEQRLAEYLHQASLIRQVLMSRKTGDRLDESA